MRADLALVGFGNVGRRFAHLLDERRASADRRPRSRLPHHGHRHRAAWRRVQSIGSRRGGRSHNDRRRRDAVRFASWQPDGGRRQRNRAHRLPGTLVCLAPRRRGNDDAQHQGRPTSPGSRRGRLECGASCRDGEQGAGGLRLSNACAVWRREPGCRSCSRARSWTVFRFSILSVMR